VNCTQRSCRGWGGPCAVCCFMYTTFVVHRTTDKRGNGMCDTKIGLLLGCLPGLAFAPAVHAQQASGDSSATSSALQEIVVTATRREEPLSKVPISVSAFDEKTLDRLGLKSAAELAALTPGVDFATESFGGSTKTSIAIRGISSNSGAGTTGIYIDDTPIQGRDIGQRFGPAYPQIFDLDSIEVLRGPQGTLFGAGSEGGTVRFITPQPSLTQQSGYARAELADTQAGAPSYEAGAAFGAPIVPEVLGFRVSAWYRRDGGYVDRVGFNTNAVIDPNANSQNASVFRAALTFAPGAAWKITPSFHYQKVSVHDTSSWWDSLSNPAGDVLRNGKVLQQPSDDKSYLPALKVQGDLGPAQLISVTSYFDRNSAAIADYTNFESAVTVGQPYPVLAGQNAPLFAHSQESYLTQELRLQSTDPAARLNWSVGAFYSKNRQTSDRAVQDVFFPQLFANATGLTIEDVFGTGLYENRYTFSEHFVTHDEQLAGFGELTYAIFSRLKLTAGVRIAHTRFDFTQNDAGPVVNPTPVTTTGSQAESPVTPKFALSYQVNSDNLLYASVAKGYRIGGGNAPIPTAQCRTDLADLGLSAGPASYKSDTVWSYEIGAKSRELDGRLAVDVSAFHINWNQI